MEEKKEIMRLELVHQQTTYKMVITQELEKKIRLLCREIHNVEWSGVLFYKVSGKFEDNTLTVTCIDLFQMDEGTGAYTEYDMNSDVATYMVDHPELLEEGVYQGLIHSHNNMPTFFSGTDTATLQSEGSDMNHFVSLIVNNAGKYTAGITRKVKSKKLITEEYSYPTWGDNTINSTKTYEVSSEYIQWFNLDIEIERGTNNFEDEILARIKEIRSNKSSRYNTYKYNQSEYNKPTEGTYIPVGIYDKKPQEKQEVKQTELPFEDEYIIDYNKYKINPNIVDWVVKQTITCSMLIPNSSAIDKEKWARSMDKLYTERFTDEKEFKIFASNFIDYLVNYTEDKEAINYLEPDEIPIVLAYYVNQELAKLPKNKWLDIWMSLYDDYII